MRPPTAAADHPGPADPDGLPHQPGIRARRRLPARPAEGREGPGRGLADSALERMVRLDIRVVTVTLTTQETVTRDGVPVQVNAVLWHKIDDPRLAVNAVHDRDMAVVQAAETSLRDSIGQHTLDDLLKNRMQVNAKLMELLAASSRKWGVEIDAVEMRRTRHPRADAARARPQGRGRARGQGPPDQGGGRGRRLRNPGPGRPRHRPGAAALEIRRLQALRRSGPSTTRPWC